MKHQIATLIIALMTCLSMGCNSAEMESNRHLKEGIQSYEKKIHDKATQSFQNALNRYSNNHQAYYYMALIDMDYHDYTAAIRRLNDAIGYESGWPHYYYQLALAHYGEAQQQQLTSETGHDFANYMECVRVLDKATNIDPYYAEAHLQKARCYIGLNDYLAAVSAYEKSIQSNPFLRNEDGMTIHYKELGELYMSFGFYKEATKVLTNGILNNPDDGQLETAFAYIYMAMKDYQSALAHFEGAYKLLEKTTDSKLHTLSAMFGVGIANYELAKVDHAEGKLRESFDHYAAAQKWLTQYANLAVIQEEELRRAGALAKLMEIQEILKEENI